MGNKKIGKAVHLTAAIVFAVLAVIAFVLFASMITEFFIAFAAQENSAEGAEQLGNGLSMVFALILMIVFGICNLALSGIGTALSATVVKFSEGKPRIVGIVLTVAHIFMIAVCVFGTAAVIISNMIS